MARAIGAPAAVILAASALLLTSGPALAHEAREVGPYRLVVGFLVEPPFSGAVNGVDLRVSEARSDAPVEGLEETLQVEVRHGGLDVTLRPELRARFGQPGAYVADFVPTRAGDYSFRFTGRIEDLEIDEVFESGPQTFSTVEDPSALQYPDPVPAGAELSDRLAELEGDLGSARAMGIVALAVAVVALVLGVAARGRARS